MMSTRREALKLQGFAKVCFMPLVRFGSARMENREYRLVRC
jgi:hypothetical protein